MTQELPEFRDPPVIEVVCGVQFKNLEGMKAPHLGLFWGEIQESFRQCEEHPLVMFKAERPDGTIPAARIRLVDVPPLPRVWFLGANGSRIIQVQRNGFLYNWRKLGDVDPYPRYAEVFGNFSANFGKFRDFLDRQGIGPAVPTQFELTYLNHIYSDEEWLGGRGVEAVFPDFGWRSLPERFLPKYARVNSGLVFPLPNDRGRLHASITTATKADDSRPLLALELTARGPAEDVEADMVEWFNMAHEWIVRGFADLTSPAAHTRFGRTR